MSPACLRACFGLTGTLVNRFRGIGHSAAVAIGGGVSRTSFDMSLLGHGTITTMAAHARHP